MRPKKTDLEVLADSLTRQITKTRREINAHLRFYSEGRKSELSFNAPLIVERARVSVYRFSSKGSDSTVVDLLVKGVWEVREGFVTAVVDDVLNIIPGGAYGMLGSNCSQMNARLYLK